jgi:hypothetical protein
VRSHAPIMFMFPPPDLARVQGQLLSPSGDTSNSDVEIKSAQPSRSFFDRTGSVTMISGRHILHQAQQYVLLDESAVAPGTKTARQKATPTSTSSPLPTATSSAGTPTKIGFPTISSPASSEASLVSDERSTTTSATAYSHTVGEGTDIGNWFNTLPNQRLKFDLQSLNLHLSMRITAVLACAEAMWEWVSRVSRHAVTSWAAPDDVQGQFPITSQRVRHRQVLHRTCRHVEVRIRRAVDSIRIVRAWFFFEWTRLITLGEAVTCMTALT